MIWEQSITVPPLSVEEIRMVSQDFSHKDSKILNYRANTPRSSVSSAVKRHQPQRKQRFAEKLCEKPGSFTVAILNNLCGSLRLRGPVASFPSTG
jgi:hypothetical protein